jgi:predicted Zn-dependent peptidase
MTTYAGAEYSQIYARTLARTMLQTLDMLAEVVRNPAITPDVIREKANRMQTGLSAMQRGGGEMLTRALLEGMYGPGHPSVRLVAMNASSLNTLTLENVREFHSKWYVPENMTLIITGSVEYASLRAVIADRFGSMPNGAAPVQRARLAAAVPGALLLVEDVHQQIVPLRIALPGPARNDPRAAAYLVLDRILGEGRSSRLFRAFWGERFIHPSFQTGIVFTRDGSALIVTGNAPLRMADSIAGIVMDVLGSIAKEGVSSAELEAAKLSLTGTYVHEFTTNRKVQTLLQDAVAYAYDPTSVTRFHHEVAAVTDQDLRTVAAMLMQRESLWMATSGTLPALHGASNSFFGERIREVSRAR